MVLSSAHSHTSSFWIKTTRPPIVYLNVKPTAMAPVVWSLAVNAVSLTLNEYSIANVSSADTLSDCGDVGDVATAGATIKPEGDCVNPCSGDPKYICGGGNRISYYTWTGATPLTQFNYASGNAAGQYQFLVGGVVVPLITTAGINGKVTFVQKFGTGPPNSTGAYELDIKTLTWREMHVKSDVFCSAGLVLPDKGARQLNVGGWSDASTFGVRLYAPNGSPGVPATNDWEENVGQVSLQVGRWYPSAMVMANGSILVVGGEAGSNGAPVPSLEVLPKPAGGAVQFCDYLQRTDPFNLYPFLAVMPSGKILIAYYNEARLLDEGTLNTVTTLPNIPGAVNNFLGGRTYPFEGTSMLLPQFAPYTAPLQVIICGGSIPGPEVALDNCASIAPEAANPKWTIERMVSPVSPLPSFLIHHLSSLPSCRILLRQSCVDILYLF